MSDMIDNVLNAEGRAKMERYSRHIALQAMKFVFSWNCDTDVQVRYEVLQDPAGEFLLHKSLNAGGFDNTLEVARSCVQQIADEMKWCIDNCEFSQDTIADTLGDGEIPPEILALLDECDIEKMIQLTPYLSEEGKDALVMSKLLRT